MNADQYAQKVLATTEALNLPDCGPDCQCRGTVATCDLCGRSDDHKHDPSEYATDREMEERFERRFER